MIIFCIAMTISSKILDLFELTPSKPIFYAGKGFCLDLAKKGMNIVLVSRSKDKLDTVAKEIEEKYSVKTKVIAVDFTKDKDVRESIEAGIKVSFCNFYLKSIIISQLL